MTSPPRPHVGKPVKVAIPCAGLDPGSTVSVKVFEPHGLGGDPVETFDATVDDAGGVARATWTYDHSKHKDKVASAVFILLAEGGGRTTASRPIAFVDTFEATVKDARGNAAAFRNVILHADRGPNVPATTDGSGKVKVDVPPGNYHVELAGPLTPDQILARGPTPDEANVQATAVPATAPAGTEAPDAARSASGSDFSDLVWLKKDGGVVGLVATSGLPDGDCTFTVYKWTNGDVPAPPPDSGSSDGKPDPGSVLGTVPGKIENGVASADWTPSDGYDPFDHDAWWVDHDLPYLVGGDDSGAQDDSGGSDDSGASNGSGASLDDLLALPALEPPVFSVESGDSWAFSTPPGVRLNQLEVTGNANASGRALTSDGRLVTFQAKDGKVEVEDHIVIVSLFFDDGHDVVLDGGDSNGGDSNGGDSNGGDTNGGDSNGSDS